MDHNSVQLVARLNTSIKELEDAIENAAKRSQESNHPILGRVHEYRGLIEKQKSFVKALVSAIQQENVAEIHRVVGLINALSELIREDARDVLANLNGIQKEEKILH